MANIRPGDDTTFDNLQGKGADAIWMPAMVVLMVVLLNKAPGVAPMSPVWARARDGAIAARMRCRPMWRDIAPAGIVS